MPIPTFTKSRYVSGGHCPLHVPSGSAVMSTLFRRDIHTDPWTPSQQKESELATPDSTIHKLFDLLQPIQLGGRALVEPQAVFEPWALLDLA